MSWQDGTIQLMKFAKAVRHLESMGLQVGTVRHKAAHPRTQEPRRRRVPVISVENGTMPQKLREMIRLSRAQSRNSP